MKAEPRLLMGRPACRPVAVTKMPRVRPQLLAKPRGGTHIFGRGSRGRSRVPRETMMPDTLKGVGAVVDSSRLKARGKPPGR